MIQERFARSQWNYFLRSIPRRRSLWHFSRIPIESWNLYANLRRHRASLLGPIPEFDRPERCGVVILSHNRPQNIDLIVRSALKNTFVSELVVSNSNPTVSISDWVELEDSRLRLVDEAEPTQPGHRFSIAQKMEGEWFLAVDDDIFLTAENWRDFFGVLLDGPQVPHGVTGNLYRKDALANGDGHPFVHVEHKDVSVDVLIGAYAFTREHLSRLFRLSRELGIENMSRFRNGEDILLSLCGGGRPRIHDLGRLFCCATSSVEGVALWKTHGNFWEERAALLEKALAVAISLDFPVAG